MEPQEDFWDRMTVAVYCNPVTLLGMARKIWMVIKHYTHLYLTELQI